MKNVNQTGGGPNYIECPNDSLGKYYFACTHLSVFLFRINRLNHLQMEQKEHI